jgi:ATP-dependent helicase/nuclease subunit B
MIRCVAFGREAEEAVFAAVVAAKDGDPWRPVTVVVPSALAGRALRRAWVRERRAIAAVRFELLGQLAGRLAGPGLAASGLAALDRLGRLGAVSQAMRRAEGGNSAGAAQPPAVESVAEVIRAGRRGGELPPAVADLEPEYARLTERTADDEDVARLATRALPEGGADPCVVYLPPALSEAEAGLVEALSSGGAAVILGLTGEPSVDEPISALARRLDPAAATGAAPPDWTGARVLAAPDPDLEGRLAAREVQAAVLAGCPPDRVGVLYRHAEPYARILRDHLAAAGLPVTGPSAATLAQSVPGRTLLGLLDLPAGRFTRTDLMAVLAAAPILDGEGRRVPVARWESTARDANVVSRPERWARRLDHLRAREEEWATRVVAGGGEAPWSAERIEGIGRLADFVAGVVDATSAIAASSGWSEAAGRCAALLDRYLDTTGLDEAGRDDLDRVRAVLVRLAGFDGWLDPPTGPVFRCLLELGLGVAVRRPGPPGGAVFIGPVGAAVGVPFDLTVVVGLAEGRFPSRADEPERREEERRAFRAVTARRPVILTSPLADPRAERPALPSRWWLEVAGAGVGRRVTAAEVAAGRFVHDGVVSLTAYLRGPPASGADRLVGALESVAMAGGEVSATAVVAARPALQRGLAAVAARQGTGFTSWEGAVGPEPVLGVDPSTRFSPTSLQTWAECPRRYLLASVLRVRETSRPEERVDLDPMAYGTLVHSALEDFFAARVGSMEPGESWSAQDAEAFERALDARCTEVEEEGLTGLAIPWAAQRAAMFKKLKGLLVQDARHRLPQGVVPVGLEVGFGGPRDEIGPVTFRTPSRTVRFKGRLDRLDAAPNGSVAHVLDYKTGTAKGYETLEEDPVGGGRLLQLPVYALAARQSYPDADITAAYWFVTDGGTRDPFRRVALDDATVARFGEVLDAIVDGIEEGVFPGNPGAVDRDSWAACRRCPYDRVCPSNRDDIWAGLAGVGELEPYRRLTVVDAG